ncbi:calcium-binding protein [Salipiger mangrovisoli]|uniref:Hemolysin-type calcium-binding repeat-containing protein n=1 Tax=Salipiger mangrovisoli TaxID=2865933 RepID=A0ABR9WYD0_9RHOB|nr:hypothetical protein [Salipiger mangrovisoli]MBE9636315.1 hypothetical protein [Salipiger mangrovisoli]
MGLYDLKLGYMDESDGVSRMEIFVNGTLVAAFNWSKWPSSDTVTRTAKTEYLLAGLALAPGDEITLRGARDGGEPLRTDYLVLTDRLTTVTGSNGADLLRGSAADERVLGLGGADRIFALGGEDLIFAGAGDDTVRSGEGDDTIVGGAGRDVIYTGAGRDMVVLTDLAAFDKLYDFEVGVDSLRVQIKGITSDDLYLHKWRLMARTDVGDMRLAIIPDACAKQATVADLLQPEVPADASTLHSLVFGEEVKSEISFAEDTDWFRFEAEAGKFYAFTLAGDPEAAAALGMPAIALRAGDGTVLGSSNDSGVPVAQLPYLASASGTFFVEASDLYGGGMGSYTLSVVLAEDLDSIPGDASTPADLGAGGELQSDLGYPGDVDWIRAELKAGSLYRADLYSEAGTNPYLSLLDASGEVLARDYGGQWATLYHRAATDIEVFLQVTADFGHEAGTGVGPYRLTLALADDIDPIAEDATTSTTLLPGEPLRSDIGYAGDEDWLRVELKGGQSYRFDLVGVADRDDPLAYPELGLYGTDGMQIAAAQGEADGAAQLWYTPETDELVFAAVRSEYSIFTGDYLLSVA